MVEKGKYKEKKIAEKYLYSNYRSALNTKSFNLHNNKKKEKKKKKQSLLKKQNKIKLCTLTLCSSLDCRCWMVFISQFKMFQTLKRERYK
jgi:hypothetical protein